MAGAVAACAMASFPEKKPVISIVEPKEVACFYESALCGDGKPHAATGSQETIMAGLNCASPCTIAWDIIKQCASYAFACNDAVTEHGMRILADPATGEKPVVAGESGAVTAGLLDHLLKDEKYQDLKKEMGLDGNAVVLLINTEGDTDPDNYKKVLGK
jgi:diaminopropionate ammonia-lyase